MCVKGGINFQREFKIYVYLSVNIKIQLISTNILRYNLKSNFNEKFKSIRINLIYLVSYIHNFIVRGILFKIAKIKYIY